MNLQEGLGETCAGVEEQREGAGQEGTRIRAAMRGKG